MVEDHDTLFILSESVHFLGIGVLAFKLLTKKNCSGAAGASLGARQLAGGRRALQVGRLLRAAGFAGVTSRPVVAAQINWREYERCGRHTQLAGGAHCKPLVGLCTLPTLSQLAALSHSFTYLHPAGLSLRTQELTAVFLTVRLFCSFMMEYDIHTLLDFVTLAATGQWVARVLGQCWARAKGGAGVGWSR